MGLWGLCEGLGQFAHPACLIQSFWSVQYSDIIFADIMKPVSDWVELCSDSNPCSDCTDYLGSDQTVQM